MKYKVGDRVKVRKDLVVGKTYGDNVFIEEMVGIPIVTIKNVNNYSDNGGYLVKEFAYCAITDEMLDGLVDENNNNTSKINLETMEKQYNEILETFKIKNKNYGNSFEISLDKYGIISALTRISDKFSRAETLILNNDKGTDDESIMDTLLDMANYCTMTAVYLKENKE